MRSVRCSIAAVMMLAYVAGCARRAPDATPSPSSTTVYLAQRIRTLDSQRPLVQALAVRDGKVLATGSRDEVLSAAGVDARVVDLGDATVVPGLSDAHGHLSSLGRSLSSVILVGADSRAEALKRLEAAPGSAFQSDWLIGQGWDQNDWPEKTFP